MAWTGSIDLNDGTTLSEVRLTTPANGSGPALLDDNTALRLLSIVETARIPLHLSLGAPLKVVTSNDETERWFRQIFSSTAGDGTGWWESARPDAEIGVLVGIEQGSADVSGKGQRVTELLFFASRNPAGECRLLTPPPSSPNGDAGETNSAHSLSVHALALSSDLLYTAGEAELTPPSSPATADEDVEAAFLPQRFTTETETINEPPVRKRRSAADAFDEANERRKKARRRGGEGVSAAAAPKTDSQLPSLKHRRSFSNTHPVPLQTRPLSRSPSVSSSRPPTAVASTTAKKSSLSQVQSSMEPTATETKNKDFISRIVMAGMRLYGLSQSKSRSKLKAESAAPSPTVDASFEDLEAERRKDEDFKLIYHQVYKGTCFTFRGSIATQLLQPFAEQVRETVDKLLAIFCSDPLDGGLPGEGAEEVTPGGRKAFGAKAVAEEKSPFMQVVSRGADTSTPSSRRREGG